MRDLTKYGLDLALWDILNSDDLYSVKRKKLWELLLKDITLGDLLELETAFYRDCSIIDVLNKLKRK